MGARQSDIAASSGQQASSGQNLDVLKELTIPQPSTPTLKSPGLGRRRNLSVTFADGEETDDTDYDNNGNHLHVTPRNYHYSTSRYDSNRNPLEQNVHTKGHHSRPRASSSSSVMSHSRHARSRSVSPSRRSQKLISPSEELRVNTRNYLRARSSSSSRAPKAIHKNDMTSFTVGSPATFRPGAYGDLGIFKSISSVNDHLYICGVMALSEEKVKALRINLIVNATLEWPSVKLPGLETVRVAVDDVPNSPLHLYFDGIADKINQVISRGGRVLVHCMAGVSRSSSLCIAYLMKYKALSLQQGLNLMRSRRPVIRPNDGFWSQLIQYEKKLRTGGKRRKYHSMTRLF